jgi:hypothetical protein
LAPHPAGAPVRGANGSPGPRAPLVRPELKGGILEKMYAIYTELDVLVKTDLKIEPGLYLETETPQQPEKLVEYIEKLRNVGHDPNKIVAYLLGTGAVRIETRNGELYLIPHSRRSQR